MADIFAPPASLNEFTNWATHAVCSEVLEHVDDPVAFLKRARDYLAPGARLIVTVPGGPMSAFDRHIGHRQHFDRLKIRSMLEQAGYSVERTYLAGFPFFNLYLTWDECLALTPKDCRVFSKAVHQGLTPANSARRVSNGLPT